MPANNQYPFGLQACDIAKALGGGRMQRRAGGGDTEESEPTIAVTVNRSGSDSNPESCRCIASQCAMWRWLGFSRDERLGCCGLAGD